MIPRIIHYCWFGGKPEPDDVKRYVDGWRRLMPDWEIKRWDESNFPWERWLYSREAMGMNSWAFVADVCRMYALWEHGGVYLDTDMESLAPLDPFLDDHSFLGIDGDIPAMGIVGAEPATRWVGDFLKLYDRRHFVNFWGHPVRTPNPMLFSRYISPWLSPDDRPVAYEPEVFYPPIVDGIPRKGPHTVGVHHFAASWRSRRKLSTRAKVIAHGLVTRWLPKKRPDTQKNVL